MTGIEMLREYAKCGLSEDTCGQVLNMLGKECDDFWSCSECHLVVCNAIAEKIKRETLPRPRFEDGTPVQFGDEFVSCDGPRVVVGIKYSCEGGISLCDADGELYRFVGRERVKRPEYDSWEKLTAEVEACDGSACRYFGRNEGEGRAPCCGCKAYNDETDCTVQVMSDIVRRAKKLAGVEE